MSTHNRKNGKKGTVKDGSLLVKKKEFPAELQLHDRIERYAAKRRFDKGEKLTKPQAAVQLLDIALNSQGITTE